MDEAVAKVHDHARAIGELCMSWAALDSAIDELLEPLLNCDRTTAASISSSIDRLEPRVEIAKRMIVHADFGEDWQKWFFAIFQRITDELGPQRNRYVHDRWRMRRGEMQRIAKRAVIEKGQAYQALKLTFDHEHVTPVGEVDRVRSCVDTVTYAIELAANDLRDWRIKGRLRRLRTLLVPASKRRTRMDRFPTMLSLYEEPQSPYSYATDPE